MKRLLRTIFLTILIPVSASAGDIPISDSPSPPPPQGITSSIAPGDIPISDVSDQLSLEALSALLSALGYLTV